MTIRKTGSRRSGVYWLSVALLSSLTVLGSAGCRRDQGAPALTCSLVELTPNPTSGYFDAYVRVEQVSLKDPLKDRLQVLTPSAAFKLADLKFTDEGKDPARLERGDMFIVPLKRPDWKLDLSDGKTRYCLENFWDRLPAKDQWHPTKTEAMTVAKGLEVVVENGQAKPIPSALPDEWDRVDEKLSTSDDPVGSLLYQKKRGEQIVEQVEVQYSPLTEDDKQALAMGSAADFLAQKSDCVRDQGREVVIANHSALACDLEGRGDFGWSYRYFYIDSGLLVAVDVQSDPQEWGKPEAQKEKERRTDQIFVRWSYGPIGKDGWENLVELRMNRTGTFHKRSRAGETVDKEFTISDEEFAAVDSAIKNDNFAQLQSRSGLPGGITSVITVRRNVKGHSVQMRNYHDPSFDDIANTIRRVVLPKVGENDK